MDFYRFRGSHKVENRYRKQLLGLDSAASIEVAFSKSREELSLSAIVKNWDENNSVWFGQWSASQGQWAQATLRGTQTAFWWLHELWLVGISLTFRPLVTTNSFNAVMWHRMEWIDPTSCELLHRAARGSKFRYSIHLTGRHRENFYSMSYFSSMLLMQFVSIYENLLPQGILCSGAKFVLASPVTVSADKCLLIPFEYGWVILQSSLTNHYPIRRWAPTRAVPTGGYPNLSK
jgi:hypothetical protein